jgi:FkbM family methyltransferase
MAGVMRIGAYEAGERYAIERFLPRHIPVIELGAGIGYISCLTNKRLEKPTRHVVVEANPAAIPWIERNKLQNQCRFSIVNAAISYGGPTASIGVDRDVLTSGLYHPETQSVNVPATSLRALLEDMQVQTCALICDIEGAEQDLINTEGAVLSERVKWLCLESHPDLYGSSGEQQLFGALSLLAFRSVWRRGTISVWEKSSLI